MRDRQALTVCLPPELHAFIEARLAAGAGRDASAVIEQALRLLRQADQADLAMPADAFLLTVVERLRDLREPGPAMAEIAAMLARQLGGVLAECLPLEAEGALLATARGTPPPWSGPLPAGLLAALRAQPLVSLPADQPGPHLPGGGGPLLLAPLRGVAGPAALLLVQAREPRQWSAGEAALVRQTADHLAEALCRARTEIALQDSESRYRTLFDAAPFAVIIIDTASHQILDVNEHACVNYGYTRQEFLRLNIRDIDALGDAAAIRAKARAHRIRPGVQQFEAQHRLKSGELREVLVRVQGVRLDGRDVTYGAHFDITDRKAAEAALQASDARLRLALEAARLGTWEFDLRQGTGSRAGPLAESLPYLDRGGFTLEQWLAAVHPEDRADIRRRFTRVARGEAPRFAAEFRVPHPEGGWIWVNSLAAVVERDPETGRPWRIAGVAQDSTERKRAELRQILMTREMDHRAKNALAVVQAALRLTVAPDLPAYRLAVEGRVAAMARAQALLAEDRWSGADLRALLEGELQPFLPGADQRLVLEGPAVLLPPGAAQPLAMVMHELATNAAKHGALSTPRGRLTIRWDTVEPGLLALAWTERDGPALPAPPGRRGFGTKLLLATMRGQLGGSVTLAWEAEGLSCRLDMPLQPSRPQEFGEPEMRLEEREA